MGGVPSQWPSGSHWPVSTSSQWRLCPSSPGSALGTLPVNTIVAFSAVWFAKCATVSSLSRSVGFFRPREAWQVKVWPASEIPRPVVKST